MQCSIKGAWKKLHDTEVSNGGKSVDKSTVQIILKMTTDEKKNAKQKTKTKIKQNECCSMSLVQFRR